MRALENGAHGLILRQRSLASQWICGHGGRKGGKQDAGLHSAVDVLPESELWKRQEFETY
jgi:hypothetical protein